ncbi:MAG: hypothetical protein JNK60_13640 [Acidobacteria bacterium]|nr:hypothetical protein [Acidobacteriota bacterium]
MRRALLAILGILVAPAAAGARAPDVASYRIEATVKGDGAVEGRETLTFTNRTDRTFETLPLGLFPDGTGGISITSVSLPGGEDLPRSTTEDRALLFVRLPSAVPPGGTLQLDIAFTARLPKDAAFAGTAGDFVLLARFFPQLAVPPASFGDVDAVLTVPSAWKGKTLATGLLVRTEDAKNGQVKLTYRAADVNDFALAACPRCEVHRDLVEEKGLPAVTVRLLLQPDHRALRARYLAAARTALVTFGSRYAPYPHAEVGLVDPPWNGAFLRGAEFPGLVVGGGSWLSPRAVPSPEGVTMHGFARQWFGRLVAGSADSPGEGLAAYAANRLVAERFGETPLLVRPFGVPVTLEGIRLPDRSASQAALLFTTAERTFSREAWDELLREYVERYAFRHPTRRDFLAHVEVHLGARAAGLLRDVLASRGRVDAAVTHLAARPAPSGRGWDSVAVLERPGETAWPVDVALVFEGGHVVERTWDAPGRFLRYRVTGGPRLLSVRLDPKRKVLLDEDPRNDGRSLARDTAPARARSHGLRSFAQHVLESMALLGISVKR